jgi:hypothetical protein
MCAVFETFFTRNDWIICDFAERKRQLEFLPISLRFASSHNLDIPYHSRAIPMSSWSRYGHRTPFYIAQSARLLVI